MRTATLLVQTLESLGVRYLFSLSGNQIMPIYDALIDSSIELIHVRHEAAAVHMADAWGRLTGTPGVALLAAGPGFANSLSATYVAQMAESPVVILSGCAPLATQGRGDFQELAQVEMATAVCKAASVVDAPQHMASALRQAFQLATAGRPGPVHLALPFDLLTAAVEPIAAGAASVAPAPAVVTATAAAIDQLVQSVQHARRPLVLVGPALMRSADYAAVAERYAAAGTPLIGMESPRGPADPARGQLAKLLATADLLVLLGKRLDFSLKLGEPPALQAGVRIFQIDADAGQLARTTRNGAHAEIEALLQADPKDALSRLAQALPRADSGRATWAATVSACLTHLPSAWQAHVAPRGEALYAAEVGNAIQKFLAGSDQGILIADGGEFCQWMQALVHPRHRIINGESGAIGSAIPFALAARLAYPDARIVACTGDGAFGFHPFEFETAVRYGLPFIAVVGNDARWNAEYQIQLRDYGPERIHQVDLLPAAYDAVVRALGGWGEAVTSREELLAALNAAAAAGQPACINVHIRGEAAPDFGE